MMCFFLSRTVANKLTRLTSLLMTGVCGAGSCGIAGTAKVIATVAVTHCIKSLCIDCMYTFLCERCPAGKCPRGTAVLQDAAKRRDGCVAAITRADNFNRKFGSRTLKSLRKTLWRVGGMLLADCFGGSQ